MLTNEDVEMLERVMLPRKEVPDLLDKQADKIIERLRPELKSIHNEFKRGSRKMRRYSKDIRAIKEECAHRGRNCPASTEVKKRKWGAKDYTFKIGIPAISGTTVVGLGFTLILYLLGVI